jgi:hypothetical protein
MLPKPRSNRGELHLVAARDAQADAILAFDNALGLGGRSPGYQLVDVLTYFSITDDMNSSVRDAVRLRPDMKEQENKALRVSFVAQAMCGVTTQFFACNNGLP